MNEDNIKSNPVDIEQTKQLFKAINNKNLDAVKEAIGKGADVNAIFDIEEKSLHDYQIPIIGKGKNRNPVTMIKNYKVIHLAAACGNPEILSYLLGLIKNHGELTIISKNTALHVASWLGNFQNLALLLDQSKIDINAKNLWGRTPLHEAVLFKHIEIVKLLLSRGANTKITDKNDFTVLHLAVKLANYAMVQLFLPPVRKSMFKNTLKNHLDLSENNYVVTLMRLNEGEHAFIIIETPGSIIRTELLIDRINQDLATIRGPMAYYIPEPQTEMAAEKTMLNVLKLQPIENWVYLAWNITKEQFDNLRQDIEQDRKVPPLYNRRGDIDLTPRFNDDCALISISEDPTLINVWNIIPLDVDVSYLRYKNKIFYINKIRRENELIEISEDKIREFDQKLQPTEKPKFLQPGQLRIIEEITKHNHTLRSKKHSCFTWAREKLVNLNIDEISEALSPKLSDWIAANPAFYLRSPGFFDKPYRKEVASAVAGAITGAATLGVGIAGYRRLRSGL